MAAETPEIRYKSPHNYVGILTKLTDNHTFDSILDILSASKYKTLITADAPIYLDTQREFWKNATLEKQGDIIAAINSSIQGKKVKISPKSISETFKLDDLNGKNLFYKRRVGKGFHEKGLCRTTKQGHPTKGLLPFCTQIFIPHTAHVCFK
ncbi:hypothetical protein HanRHA438_Chr03g0124921 [Helianthus annuus]|nr:hypothetical protein HanRHA438_Chr03g0124921 [Helianthus annuus]